MFSLQVDDGDTTYRSIGEAVANAFNLEFSFVSQETSEVMAVSAQNSIFPFVLSLALTF